MAHYAFLSGNTVIEIIVGIDETELIEGLSPEEWYSNFRGQRCIRTSYNGKIRGKYAAIGDYYDEATDTFISPTYIKEHDEESNSTSRRSILSRLVGN
jgi:hypothetical protein